MTDYVFDIECNGFNPDKIHCIVANGKEVDKSFFEGLSTDDLLIGHNIIRFDIPILEKLLNIKIKAQLIDTLALSWYLFPTINRHGLEQWGERLKIEKPIITDWDNELKKEEYLYRCKEDVKINTKLWAIQLDYLNELYDGEPEPLMRYLSFKLKMAQLQEQSRWRLDVDKANTLLNKLELKNEQAINELSKVMPKVPKIAKRKRPKLPFKQDGSLSVAGERWKVLAEDNGFTIEYDQEIEEVVGEDEPNPTSSHQVKAWLFTLGWTPTTFNFIEDRKIPQIKNKDGELCKSIKKLSDLHPEVLVLEDMAVVKHRIGLVKGLLKNEKGGFVVAAIQGLTNTLRFKHAVCVNLPSSRKPYGLEIRGLLTSHDDKELCGSDLCSLEDRVKQHYVWEHDPEYVREMSTEGFDPHLDLALSAGAITKQEVKDYKNGIKTDAISQIRFNFKGGNYALQYGAGIKTLSKQLGITMKEAKVISEAYWERNCSVKAIDDSMVTKEVEGSTWQYNPVSKLWYSLRSDKDKFSTLCQGTGTYLFDMWVGFILKEREQLTANFHDEIILEVRINNRDRCIELLQKSIQKVNSLLKLNRVLEVDIQFGNDYSKIH